MTTIASPPKAGSPPVSDSSPWATDSPPRARRGPLLFALVLSVSVVLLGTTILNVALPAMQRSLHLSGNAEQWVLNSYSLTFAGCLLVAGIVGDRVGYRRLLVGALGLFALSAGVGSIAHNGTLLIAMRAVMGVAAAGIMPTTLAIISRVLPPAQRPAAITIWAAFSGTAIALGPILGGALLTAGLWWGSVLAMVGVLAAVAIPASLGCVPDLPGSGEGTLRLSPVLGSVGGVGLLVWGVLNGGQNAHWLAPLTLIPGLGGLLVLAVLAASEARHAHPLADVRLFGSPLFSVATLVLTVGTFSVYGFLYFTTFYLELGRALSPLLTGLYLIPLSAGLIIAAPLSRRLTVWAGAPAAMATGMAITAAVIGAGALIGVQTTAWLFMLDALGVGFGFGLVLSPGTAAAMSAVPGARLGAGSALLNTMRQIGSALGVAVLGSLLWSAYRSRVAGHLGALAPQLRPGASQSLADTLALSGHHPALVAAGTQAFDGAMHVTAIIAAGVCAVGLLGALVAILGRR